MAIEVDLKCEVVGGASSFIQLTDTPNDYTGEAGKVPVVNGAEDGLEFANIAGGGVQTVTGDGVDNTDPLNPVMSYPAPSDIGLGNVDNTSDLDKPISLSTQTALDGKEDDLGNPVTDNYILSSTSAGVRSWIPNAAGGNIIEDGTTLKYGTGADVGTGGNRRFAGGGNTLADTDDSFATGYNAKTGSKGFAIGINNGFVTAGAGAMGIGNDIREIEAQSLVITALSNQSTVGLRTKSQGSVMIGTNLNINSQAPTNGTVNRGVFIGSSITSPVANLGAAGIMIGKNLNCGASYEMILIGKDTTVDAGANYQRTVAIGDNLVLNENNAPNGVVIGYRAGGGISAGTGATGGQFVSIGTETFAGSWRCTVVGSFSRADYVSSTILGYGCYSGVAHGNIFGRGGYLLNSPITGGSSTLLHSSHTNDVVIVGNAYAKFTNPYVEGSNEVVNNVTAQNNGTVIHRITTASGLDVDETPTASNVKGAILDISAGVGTGTATSGELRFSSAPAGASGNTENALEIAAKIDAESGVDTRFLLLDVTDDTIKRVEFGGNDLNDPTKKTLVVDGGTGAAPSGVVTSQSSIKISSISQGTALSGTAYASIFIAESSMSVSELCVFVSSSAASNCYVGVYSEDGNTLLGEAVISTSTNGLQTASLIGSDFNITAGSVYWVAILEGGGAANLGTSSCLSDINVAKSKFISGTPTGMPSNLSGFTASNVAPYVLLNK